MINRYQRQHGWWHDNKMHFHLYRDPQQPYRCLLLLHGIRLGGVETWEPIIRDLTEWSDILVPEIPGVGALNPLNESDHDIDLETLLTSLIALIERHKWVEFDVFGYSYGGFLSMMLGNRLKNRIKNSIVFESALLADEVENLHQAGTGLLRIANIMRTDAIKGNESFSEIVFAKKSPRQFPISTQKLKVYNPLGFVNLISILNEIYLLPVPELWKIIENQPRLILLMTLPLATEKIKMLRCFQERCSWKVIYLENADHATVLTNPTCITDFLIQLAKENI